MDATDSFTDPDNRLLHNHTMNSGHYWFRGSGVTTSCELLTGQCKDQSGNAPVYYCSALKEGVDYDVQADITAPTSSGEVNGRQDPNAVTRYAVLYVSGATEWRLVKVVAGVTTTLATYVGDVPSSTRTVKLQILDATKKLFIGGVERASTTDNAITAAGRAGLRGSGITTDRIDNWISTNSIPPDGGGMADDRYRFRSSQLWSGTSTLGTKRACWPDDARDFGRRDSVADNVSRSV